MNEKIYFLIGGEHTDFNQKARARDTFYQSGKISNKDIDELYMNAKVVVFPSYYEGFGFPVLKALSQHKPIFVQDNEINRELAGLLSSKNIYLYSSQRELSDLVARDICWLDDDPVTHSLQNWEKSAQEIVEFCLTRYNNVSLESVRRRRRTLKCFELGDEYLNNNRSDIIYSEHSESISSTLISRSLELYSKIIMVKECIFLFAPRKRIRYSRMRAAIMALISKGARPL